MTDVLEGLLRTVDDHHARIQSLEVIDLPHPHAVDTYTTTQTLTIWNRVVLVDATAGDFTVTLPAATVEMVLYIKKTTAANIVTVARAGADTIEGAASVAIAGQYKGYNLVSDGSGIWYILSST